VVTVRRFARKNLIAHAVIALIACAVCLAVVYASWGDARNLVVTSAFDPQKAAADFPPRALDTAGNGPGAFIAGLPYDIDEEAKYIVQANLYYQSGGCVFGIQPEQAFAAGEADGASGMADPATGKTAAGTPLRYDYFVCRLGGLSVLVKVPLGAGLPGNAPLRGVFVPFGRSALSGVSANLAAQNVDSVENLFPYLFDTVDTFVFNRLVGMSYVLLMAALIAVILYFLIRQMVSRKYQPIYKQLELFAADEDDLNRQLAHCAKDGKKYVTGQWVFTPGLLKTKLEKLYTDRKDLRGWSYKNERRQ